MSNSPKKDAQVNTEASSGTSPALHFVTRPHGKSTLLTGQVRPHIEIKIQAIYDQHRVSIFSDYRTQTFGEELKRSEPAKLMPVIPEGKTKASMMAAQTFDSDVVVSMPAQNLHNPPRSLEIAFRILLPARVRDAILGDAQEAFHDTLQRSGDTRLATFDYAKEIVYAIIGATWMRLERLISLLRRGS